MAQGFQQVYITDFLKDSLPLLMSNDEAAISCNAGTSFPTENTKDGMLCYRTDEKKLYQLQGTEWKDIVNLQEYIDRGQLGEIKTLAGCDLNTLKRNGRYWVNQTGQSNGPTGTGGLVEVYTANESNPQTIVQSFLSGNGNNISHYFRITTNGGETWFDWSNGVKASSSVAGTVQLATNAEAKAGTVATKALTPANLKQFMEKGQLGGVKDLGTNVDLDTLTESGNYWALGSGITNAPEGHNGAAIICVYRPSDRASNMHQVFMGCGNKDGVTVPWIYHRHTVDEGWGKWAVANVATDAETLAATKTDVYVTPSNLKQFIDRGQLGSYVVGATNPDLNTYTEQGNYWIIGTGQTNGPRPISTGGVAGVLNVFKTQGSTPWIMQIFTEVNNTQNGEVTADCWHRTSTNNGTSWSAWCTGTPASETVAGTVKLATSDEVTAGTNDKKAITPKTLKEALSSLEISGDYLPLTGGTVTGDTTFTGTLKSGASGKYDLTTRLVKSVSVSGRTVTFTYNDNTTSTITTQDTTGGSGDTWTVSKGINGWARNNSNSFTIVWGRSEFSGGQATISFSRTFTVCYVVVLGSYTIQTPYLQSNPSTKSFIVCCENKGAIYFSWAALGFS